MFLNYEFDVAHICRALKLGVSYIGNSISESAAVHPIPIIKLEGDEGRMRGVAKERVRICV